MTKEFDYHIELTDTGYKYFWDKTYELLIDGSAGSGKTKFACYKTIMYALTYKNAEIYVIRKTRPALKQTVWKEIMKILQEMGIRIKPHLDDLTIRFLDTGSLISFVQIDDERKIRSANLDMIYIEQVEELIKYEDFYKTDILFRLGRGPACQKHGAYPQMLCVAQPESPHHWVYKRFHQMEESVKQEYEMKLKESNRNGTPAPDYNELLNNMQNRRKAIKFHYLENKWLPKEQLETYERLKYENYNLWQRFAEGEWVTLDGKIYDNYKIVDEIPTCDFYTTGSDFGYTNPACTLLTGWRGKDLYIVDEVYVKNARDSEFAELSRKMLYDNRMLPEHLLTSVGDTQNPNGIESLKMEGFPINEDYKKPLIISSVNQVKELNIYIHKNCENTIKEIESYVYEKNKNGESEKPVKFNDHAMDALRYNVNNVLTDYRGSVLSDGGVSDWESIMVLGKNGEFL